MIYCSPDFFNHSFQSHFTFHFITVIPLLTNFLFPYTSSSPIIFLSMASWHVLAFAAFQWLDVGANSGNSTRERVIQSNVDITTLV